LPGSVSIILLSCWSVHNRGTSYTWFICRCGWLRDHRSSDVVGCPRIITRAQAPATWLWRVIRSVMSFMTIIPISILKDALSRLFSLGIVTRNWKTKILANLHLWQTKLYLKLLSGILSWNKPFNTVHSGFLVSTFYPSEETWQRSELTKTFSSGSSLHLEGPLQPFTEWIWFGCAFIVF